MVDSINKEIYEGSESFKGSNQVGIKEIALNRFQVALAEGAKEMTRGGLQTRLIEGNPIRFIVPNQCEIFINSVKMAYQVVEPEINICSEKSIKGEFKQINKELKDAEKLHDVNMFNNSELYKPKMQSADIEIQQDGIAKFNYGIQTLENNFEKYNVKIHRELLLSISKLLHHLDYFSEGGLEDS